MLNFELVIQHLGPKAVSQLGYEAADDDLGLIAIGRPGTDGRVAAVRKWMDLYKVFLGITGAKRDAIAKATLDWADLQVKDSKLDTLELLVHAHAELMAACSGADGRGRDFTSLTSKALWLRYPNAVPLYDRFAQEALWMISKLERGLPPTPNGASKYGAFAVRWKFLCDRYAPAIEAIDNKGYPYRVRIFDRILWFIGQPVYGSGGTLQA